MKLVVALPGGEQRWVELTDTDEFYFVTLCPFCKVDCPLDLVWMQKGFSQTGRFRFRQMACPACERRFTWAGATIVRQRDVPPELEVFGR